MARPRTELGHAIEAKIGAMARAGKTAEEIAAQLKADGAKGVSRATIGRRLRELRGKVRVGRVATKKRSSSPRPPPSEPQPPSTELELPESPDQIPDDLSIDTLKKLFQKANNAADHALGKNDLATFGSMGRLVTALGEAIRKATPPEKPDVNDQPDMIAAAERARKKLHELVDRAVGCD